MTWARSGSLTDNQQRAVTRYEQDAMKLPEYPKEWTRDNVDIGHGAIIVFHKQDLVERIRYDDSPEGWSNGRNIWRTADGVTEWVEENIVPKSRTPCGCSTGIRTIEAGQTYTCRNDDCDCQFSRDIAEEVVG